jgi:hypothetical protein
MKYEGYKIGDTVRFHLNRSGEKFESIGTIVDSYVAHTFDGQVSENPDDNRQFIKIKHNNKLLGRETVRTVPNGRGVLMTWETEVIHRDMAVKHIKGHKMI